MYAGTKIINQSWFLSIKVSINLGEKYIYFFVNIPEKLNR